MNKKKMIVRIISIMMIYLVLSAVTVSYCYSIDKFSSNNIMNKKKLAYSIYNEGLRKCKINYNSLTIESPNDEDKDIVFDDGLKYVSYPDLMKLKLKNAYGEIVEFSDNEFKIYERSSAKYLKITVQKDKINNISYYEYSENTDYIKLIKKTLLMFMQLIAISIIAITISLGTNYIMFFSKHNAN